MKQFFLMSLFLGMFLPSSQAQIWSRDLRGQYGFRTITYAYGYYEGYVNDGYADGEGTFYYRDGTIFHGNYYDGYRDGKGVLVSPEDGYLVGYWEDGTYVGCSCRHNQSDYDEDAVENIVYQQRKKSESTTQTSPEGYKIKKIEPESRMGKTVLGRYNK
jgi:hypothetical protein